MYTHIEQILLKWAAGLDVDQHINMLQYTKMNLIIFNQNHNYLHYLQVKIDITVQYATNNEGTD